MMLTAGRVKASGGLLAAASRGALIFGVIWSVFCTLYAGRGNASWVLRAMFAVWVASPFAGFAWAIAGARKRHIGVLRALLMNSIVVTVTSVMIYSAMAFGVPSHQKTFAFLVVPAASWLAVGSFVVASRFTKMR